MTEVEALKLMKIEKECINRDCDRDCAKCDIVQELDYLNIAYDIAINALERQIPKKPCWRIEEDAKGYACPICNMGVTIDHGRIREAFCSSCGQRIDWTDKGLERE